MESVIRITSDRAIQAALLVAALKTDLRELDDLLSWATSKDSCTESSNTPVVSVDMELSPDHFTYTMKVTGVRKETTNGEVSWCLTRSETGTMT